MGGRLEVGDRTLCLRPPEGVGAAEWSGDRDLGLHAGPLRTLLWRSWREVERGVAA
jgi:hypothetical protein